MSWRSLLKSMTGRYVAEQGSKPSPTLTDLINALEQINSRLQRLEFLSHGGRSVFCGNNRIMTKINLRHWNIAYLLQADDLLLAPPLITNGYHEIDVTDYFINNLRSENNCIDVGANFGYFTCIMGRWSSRGKTIAIEPDRAAFELLRDNIYINCLEGVAFAHNVAASEAKGSLTLHRRITRSGNTSIAQPADVVLAQMGEPSSQAFQAVCVPIDQFLPEFRDRVDCIKIDVEGAEPLVLRGAQETLARNPQIKVVMEWSPGQMRDAGFDPREFTEMLNRLTLSAALITTGGIGQPVTWEQLLSLPYHPGILLTR